MKNCIDCKHLIGSDLWKNTPRYCELGNTAVFDKWWEDNKNKKRDKDIISEVDCYVPTNASIFLDNMISMASEIKTLLIKENK